jgi:GT2 family glycosyltransferase
VPAVVAVVVTRDPGPWIEECLGALAAQDYPELVVVVVAAGGADPTARIARSLPGAFVRRIDEPLPFGAAANEVLGVVDGAAFFLVCHDDCAPDPSAVRLMVEESFRSNAAIVSPKLVRWDDPRLLLQVGMNADKTGAVVNRVQSPEIDHGQHDGVRDVFVAPSGCFLIRADLMAELGGFDPVMVAMAEDLDLCWRAHVAGARVIVAPDARVRHLDVTASGVAPVMTGADARTSLQALQRRHELRTVLKCSQPASLLVLLPQILVLNLGEVLLSLAIRDLGRVRAVVGAWRWNFAHRADLLAARRAVQRTRRVTDGQIRRNQLRGSARLSEYLSRISHLGFEGAHGSVDGAGGAAQGATPELTGSIAGAFSEDDSFDEDWDDRGHRPRSPRPRLLASRRSRLLVGLITTLLLVIGARHLIGGAFPTVGQLVQLSSWSTTWHRFFATWHPQGLGTTAPASPSSAALGTLGTVLLGGMGLTQKVLVFGCVPVGAWGVSRLLAPFGSRRGRLLGALAYLGLPLVYDALARGRLDVMVSYALAPWIVAALMRASGLEPYAPPAVGRHGRTARTGWLGLGVLVALGEAFAPAVVLDVLVITGGLWLGSLFSRTTRQATRVVPTALGAILAALVLTAPWVIGVALAGPHALGVLGEPSAPARAVGWAALLRFDLGPVGGSWLSWLLPAAGLLPVLVGTGHRLAWAARLWTVALLAFALGFVVERGWTGSFAPTLGVILAPAAVAVAAGVGLGVAAFESDLVGLRFGWRQLAASVLLVAAAFGSLPVVAEVANGSFGLPASGYGQALQFVSARSGPSFRVLWLGDPAVLPVGSWSITPGLAYATTDGGPPNAGDLYAPAAPGPAAQLAQAVELAQAGRTVHLGRLLAPAAVRYVVVVEDLAPTVAGLGGGVAEPPPPGLVPALDQQRDLRQVPGGSGFVVYDNTVAIPERAARRGGEVRTTRFVAGLSVPASGDLSGWRPVLGSTSGAGSRGPVGPGTVYAAMAPGGAFHLTVGRARARAAPAFSWAVQFKVTRPGEGVLTLSALPWGGIGGALELALWLAVAALLLDRRLKIRTWLARGEGRAMSAGARATAPRSPGGRPEHVGGLR